MLSKNKSRPTISVIMGVYNIASLKGFRESVQSVLGQNYTNFEYIICDDGSNDGTWRILEEIAKEDKRVVLLKNDKNMGLAATLNHCLEKTLGDYIARQDADDFSDISRFERQLDFLETHPQLSFCGSNVYLFDEEGLWGSRLFPALPKSKDFLFSMPFVHGTLMFRREALVKVGAYRVSKETRRAEDYDMLMRMYALGLRGGNMSEKLYWFREDKAAQNRRKYKYRIDELRVRYKGFTELGLMPEAIVYVIKPLVVGLIPNWILQKIKAKIVYNIERI